MLCYIQFAIYSCQSMELSSDQFSTSSPSETLSVEDSSHESESELETELETETESDPTPARRLVLWRGNVGLVSSLSSLAINLFLPFINGMMLGFGEILAHELGFKWGWVGARVSIYEFGH
jgi:hypothetical protein